MTTIIVVVVSTTTTTTTTTIIIIISVLNLSPTRQVDLSLKPSWVEEKTS
jgi:hypothetical protein